jgi:type II secretory pathway component GspD/PulD (secretin)
MKIHRLVVPALLAVTFAAFSLTVAAQDKPAEGAPQAPAAEHRSGRVFDPTITDCRKQPNRTQMVDCTESLMQTRTIYLANETQQNDANEILIAIRNMFDPGMKIYLISSKNALTIGSYPAELDRIQAFIKTLDIPRHTYRLTFTLTDFDGDKAIGTQHFNMFVVSGQRTTFKQGTKIPVATGTMQDSKNGAATQFTYLDVGMSFDVTLSDIAGGARLDSKIEQSSVAPEPVNILGVNEPIIRQSVIQGASILSPGKPVMLGSADIAGSTHHLDITVLMEPIH